MAVVMARLFNEGLDLSGQILCDIMMFNLYYSVTSISILVDQDRFGPCHIRSEVNVLDTALCTQYQVS